MATALDLLMPAFDVRTSHQRPCKATAGTIGAAVKRFDVRQDSSLLVRALLMLRGIPPGRGLLIESMKRQKFQLVAEQPDEIVLGVAGRFWVNKVEPFDTPASYDRPGSVIALMSLSWADGIIRTETRVRCVDDVARKRFRPYWAIVGPFSGLIRKDWLRAIAGRAERGSG